MAMDRLFHLMKEKNASDMFFAVNSPVQIKINGNLIPINQQKLDPDNIEALLSEVASPAQMAELKRENDLNMGISVPNTRTTAGPSEGAAITTVAPAFTYHSSEKPCSSKVIT